MHQARFVLSATSNVRPSIEFQTTAAFNGSYVVIYCQNTPMGYADTEIYTINGVNTSASGVTLDSTNAGKEVTCTLTSPSSGVTFSNPTSAVAKLPILVTNVLNVTVIQSGPVLECSFIPYSKDYDSRTFIFTWQMDGETIDNESSPIFFPSVVGSYDVTCTVQMNNEPVVPSINKFRVNFGYAALIASATTPLQGGRVILTCARLPSDHYRYLWAKDNNEILGQHDRQLQLDNVSALDSGLYMCAKENRFYQILSKNIYVVNTISKPVIEIIGSSGSGTRFGENGDYWLVCTTDSGIDSMTYEWTINGVKASVTDKFYPLRSITSSKNGVYVCKAMFKNLISESSDPRTVTVTKPGKLCYYDNMCVLPYDGYTDGVLYNISVALVSVVALLHSRLV
nr:carcinoembryonic antigen-related cell adhesion molecule 1-like [Biomphalaria glabrata]